MNHDAPAPTFLAPAERANPASIRELASLLLENPVAQAILDSVSGLAVILDEHRQIVAANTELMLAMNLKSADCLLGMRPGEALKCIHAHDGPGGCGTGPSCQNCGAVLSILASQTEGVPDVRECLLSRHREGEVVSDEYRVRSTPVTLDGKAFTVFLLQDISSEKRKEALESVFFHDVLNLVGGIQGVSHLLQMEAATPDEVAHQILDLSSQLAQEILSQRLLMSAERGELALQKRAVSPQNLLDDLAKVFANHEVAQNRHFHVKPAPEAMLDTDPVLVSRVLINMVKNAFEACPPEGMVTAGFEGDGADPRFWVHNPGVMPPQVQQRIFQRSFSTKALRGRGLGTYSMKIFGERYLGGQVGFTSEVGAGTTFWLHLPKEARLDGPNLVAEPSPESLLPIPEVPEPVPETARRHRVLLVDDSRTVLGVLSKVLGDEHDVFTASRGEEALAFIAQDPPDLVLLDVIMPGMDGYEVCAKLKADPRHADIPVIFLSGMSQEKDEAIGLTLGAIDYIHKPISPAIVSARVRNHLELKRYRDMLKEMSFMDGLTAVANRRRFNEALDQEWQRAQRQDRPISLAMIDIDHFKAFNDTYGHLKGDDCLRSVAQALKRACQRVTDLVARYGGEEFAVIMPDTDPEGARQVVERLLQEVRALQIPHAHSSAAPMVTISVGVVTVAPRIAAPLDPFKAEADALLYRAKHEGRNQFRQGTLSV